ncbi:DUF7858 family protein [Halomicrococcus sp. SG-WS-1]|uniref:DUF7858 family protein n=1 Tax=Halomicrococcus sp. SG-WS-1 TaxID=3439057 RepID=UPI003F7B2CB7
MTLSDIAAGLEVTAEQRDRGVAAVDDTDGDLRERLVPFADDLPCDPTSAATVVESFTAGASVGDAGRDAGVAPVTAAKTLHLLGLDGVSPLGPTARDVVGDWLTADLSRSDAKALTGASETEFALAAFVETHDPLDGAVEAVEGALSPAGDATVRKRDELGETMSDVGDLL